MKSGMYRIYHRDKTDDTLKVWKLLAAFVRELDAKEFISLCLFSEDVSPIEPDYEIKLTHYNEKKKKTFVLRRYKGGQIQ